MPLHSKAMLGDDKPNVFAEKTRMIFVPERIAQQAESNPAKVALAGDFAPLTFGELESRARQLAQKLQTDGIKPEALVALCLERSPDFVIAALAIMKCGAAYLPIDPAHPAERLRFIINDADARLLITQKKFRDRFEDLEIKTFVVEEVGTDQPSGRFQPVNPLPENLAYVIYTSGSTGTPKGVEITYANLSNLIAWHTEAFGITANDRATFQAGIGFDAAVWEIWPHLAAGCSLHLPDESTRLSAPALRDWFVAEKITVSFVPTAIAEQLLTLSWPNDTALRFLLTGADTLHRRPPANLPFAFVNNYGPTECTVVATSGRVAPADDAGELPSIGRPIKNATLEIIDGEIFLGGAGVARGYRNRPDLTAERFVTNPSGARCYRTGDLGRVAANGEITFLGRADDQVKIRGNRIELEEINDALKKNSAVQTSIVLAREDVPGEKKLVAYLVAATSTQPNEQNLRDFLRTQLPDYMMPSAFVWLETLPLNANGKIDRAALPPPSASQETSPENFVAPRTPVEETLAGIIAEVLKLPRVSVDDDFFHLGAHSLLGAQIIARVREIFGLELKLLDVFDAPTTAQLAKIIETKLERQLAAMSDAEVEAALAARG